MRFIPTFNKICTFQYWLELIDKLKPHFEKHGIRNIFVHHHVDQPLINKQNILTYQCVNASPCSSGVCEPDDCCTTFSRT